MDLGVDQLALYYLHLAHGTLGNRCAAEQAWARFLDSLDRWRRALERRPPDPASFSVIDRIRLRSQQGVHRAELEGTRARLGAEASRSRARYYLGLASWRLGRLSQARLHLEGFLEHLEAEDRQSLAATEAARALASIGAAQGQRG